MLDRRRFLVTTATTAFAAAISPSTFALSSHSQKSAQSEISDYQSKIGDTFYARSENGSTALTLTEMRDISDANGLQQFTLVFKTQSTRCDDGLYNITHIKSFNSTLVRLDKSDTLSNTLISTFCLLK